MASSSTLKHAPCLSSAVDISGPILKYNCTYVPEPPWKTKRDVSGILMYWYPISLHVLLTLSWVLYLGKLKKNLYFGIFLPESPLLWTLSVREYLIFMKNRVFRLSSSTNNPFYIKWLDKVQQKKGHVCKDHGIFDPIQLSRVGPKYNSHMLIVAIFFWESPTYTFHLPCGMITPTHFYIVAIVGLRPTGEIFDLARITKTKPKFTYDHPSYNTYIKENYASTENVGTQENTTFLTYWLSCYVFCSSSLQVAKKFVPLATQVHERRDVCLSKLILCGLYGSLGISSHNLKERENPESLLVFGHVWLLQ